MATINASIEEQALKGIAVAATEINVVAAYLFGSQIDGSAHRWSDIDLAVFSDDIDDWDMHDHARLFARVMKEAGTDVELHLFSAVHLQQPDPASFARWIIDHGVRIYP
jgi:predicted nucleotidyltransferase